MENQELIMGVYRIYDTLTQESFVGFSHNITGTLKRLRFELTLNACSYSALQAFWNEHRDHIAMETVETYQPAREMSQEEIDAHLKALLYRAKELYSARLVQVQV